MCKHSSPWPQLTTHPLLQSPPLARTKIGIGADGEDAVAVGVATGLSLVSPGPRRSNQSRNVTTTARLPVTNLYCFQENQFRSTGALRNRCPRRSTPPLLPK